MNKLKTYILHFDKLKERKIKLEKELTNFPKLDVKWFLQIGYYSDELINDFYEYDKKLWKEKVRIANRPVIFYPLSKSQKHLVVNHMIIRKLIAEQSNDYALVLEDDIKFPLNFDKKIMKFIEENKEWDIIYLEKGLEENTAWNNGGYIIKKDACKKIINLGKVTLPNDEELRYRIKKLNLKPLFYPIISQEGNSKESGQHQREKQGIKKYIYWRKPIYSKLPKFIVIRINKFEEKVKRIILGM